MSDRVRLTVTGLRDLDASAALFEELRAALDAAVARLSPEHRAVFVLHAVEGMSYKDIAEAVGAFELVAVTVEPWQIVGPCQISRPTDTGREKETPQTAA